MSLIIIIIIIIIIISEDLGIFFLMVKKWKSTTVS